MGHKSVGLSWVWYWVCVELESVYRSMYSTLLMVLTNILTATGKDRNVDPERNVLQCCHITVIWPFRPRYRIFCDNFYSCPTLFADLKKKGFEACGTVRINRRDLPEAYKKMKCAKGKHGSSHCNLQIIVLKFRRSKECLDSRQRSQVFEMADVHIISTYHGEDVIEKFRRSRAVAGGVETIKKPRMIEDYNKNMNGVDQNDQNVKYYGFPHR